MTADLPARIDVDTAMKNSEKKTLTNLGKNTKLLKNIKFPNKKDTVKKILDTDNYWKQRESSLNKSFEEKYNKSIFRKEIEEFNDCIMKIKEPQYDLNYFQTREPDLKHFWEDNWGLFLKVR